MNELVTEERLICEGKNDYTQKYTLKPMELVTVFIWTWGRGRHRGKRNSVKDQFTFTPFLIVLIYSMYIGLIKAIYIGNIPTEDK